MVEVDLPEGPWVEVGTDVFEFKDRLYLIALDYYTKWIEIRLLASQTSESVIEELRSNLHALECRVASSRIAKLVTGVVLLKSLRMLGGLPIEQEVLGTRRVTV